MEAPMQNFRTLWEGLCSRVERTKFRSYEIYPLWGQPRTLIILAVLIASTACIEEATWTFTGEIPDGDAKDVITADGFGEVAPGDTVGDDTPTPPKDTIDTVEPKDTIDTVEPKDTVDTIEPEDTDDTIEPKDTIDTIEPEDTTPDICEPDCVDKDCGDDGCGGSCGDCDDGNPCTTDSCEVAGVCAFTLKPLEELVVEDCVCEEDADCDALEDDDLCNGGLTCDTGSEPSTCAVDPDSVVACDTLPDEAAPECNLPTCVPETGLCSAMPANDGASCSDGAGTCASGLCCIPDCTEKECGNDGCGGTCGTCEAGDLCTGEITCADGICEAAGGLDCDDGNQCSEDSCDPVEGCQYGPMWGQPCDDGEFCTPESYCAGVDGMECDGDGWEECDDGNPCTNNQCIEGGLGCYNSPTDDPCDDGNACTVGDECFEGDCLAGAALDCNDNDECTDDSCDTETGCVHVENSGPCQSGQGICYEGACCISNCGAKTCGDDGCGGSCGVCEDGATCNENFACAADDPTFGVTWISIPGGTFMMGCAAEDLDCEGIEIPQHAVTLTAFEMLETEVTEGQFLQVMGFDPSCDHNGGGGENAPVECLDWYQAHAYCAAIGGRLPTEAEREYAARAHDTTFAATTWICGDDVSCLDTEAWWTLNAGDHKHDVRGRSPNAFGLYDMSGNVNEWVWDWLDLTYYQTSPADDPLGPVGGSDKILRGGAFSGAAYNQRVSNRPYAAPTEVGYWIGVRCVRGGACVPDCVGKQCGDDGCGGSCGACDAPAGCNENFVCAETDGNGLTWVTIPAGDFEMGCVQGEDGCLGPETPAHDVAVESFEILETEVTRGQFLTIVGSDPSCSPGDGNLLLPVECISWADSKAFCEAAGGRLPSEAEWAYAARAGTTTTWGCGMDSACLDASAWWSGNAATKQAVGGLAPNAFGLYDVWGNMSEWVEDCWHLSYDSAPAAGLPAWTTNCSDPNNKTLRGGSFKADADGQRVFVRNKYFEGTQDHIGFRCARGGPCFPSCDGKQCGDDGCGGSCGDCEWGATCNENFVCAEDGAHGVRWITIPAGGFFMGCVSQDPDCADNEFPLHWVTMPAFQLLETEVTEGQYLAATGLSPSAVSVDEDAPVESIDWHESKAFCEGLGARLPTETEWEYAVRAGTDDYYSCGDDPACLDNFAWLSTNAQGAKHIVAEKDPSPWGLYDMSGNVSEWVGDCWHNTYTGGPWTATPAWDWDCDGIQFVVRGGKFSGGTKNARASARLSGNPAGGSGALGVRCARSLCGDGACGPDEGCGDCPEDCPCEGDELCLDGVCCAPDCDGKTCGDDGCGGSCGTCELGDDCEDGACVTVTWSDPGTGILWQLSPEGAGMQWSLAVLYCEDLELGGYDDWSLPTITQLRSLIVGCPATTAGGACPVVDDCAHSVSCYDYDACVGCGYNQGPTDPGCYWPEALATGSCTSKRYFSSTLLEDDATSAWRVDWDDGQVASVSTSTPLPAVCVRCDLSCDGKECGGDGCGGSCGECGVGELCMDNLCAPDPDVAWVDVPGDTYTMGCSPVGGCSSHELPNEQVTVADFRILQTEVTQAQFEATLGAHASVFDCPGCPQESVTREEASEFCVAVGGELCSEGRWEYAARGGTTTQYYCGDDAACLGDIAWYSANSDATTHPAGLKEPNDFGLYDMLGNVWEWTADCWHWNYVGVPPDGAVWDWLCDTQDGVWRGSAYHLDASPARVSNRNYADPTASHGFVGFRCCQCIYDCEGKQCGDDGCGGSCGECESPTSCNENFVCAEEDATTGLTWVSIPEGDFEMGCSPGDEECSSAEYPLHTVAVTAFEILETEVTEAQWALLITSNPDPSEDLGGGGGAGSPVENISRWDAQEFCETADPDGRLCTEAEWEYAARAGTTTKYPCGTDAACLDDIAWHIGNAEGHKHDAGTKDPNGFGLHDMIGNVWEWVADCWHDDYDMDNDGSADIDVSYPPWNTDCGEGFAVLRGGSIQYDSYHHRSSRRWLGPATLKNGATGFRCCRSECVPDCSGKVCGDDGCGGTCGSCEAPASCNENFVCAETDAAGFTWVTIPEGDFQMGCVPQDTGCTDDEKPQHPVAVASFELLETEVTEGQYLALTGLDPSCDHDGGGGADSPVECVGPVDAKAFCQAIGGRLPTEAEWEYAARAGTTTIYSCGDDAACLADIAWTNAYAGGHKRDVRGKAPNDFGLYDMAGNVQEILEDCYHGDGYLGAPDVGFPAWSEGCVNPNTVWIHGGGFGNPASSARASYRAFIPNTSEQSHIGFRCARGGPCTPDCDGTQCGESDGCGGICMGCGDLEECTWLPGGGWSCTATMVEIPAGEFWMGCNSYTGSAVNDGNCGADEHPYHLVFLSDYELDRTSVTLAQYTACYDAGVCTSAQGGLATCNWPLDADNGDHPINCVDWSQAEAYCAWAGKRLPTEAEWEKGARGGCEHNLGSALCKAYSRKFPWGNDDPTCSLAALEGCPGDTQPVCSLSPAGDSPYGLCDMAGNTWDWVADWSRNDYYCQGDLATDNGCQSFWDWPGAPDAWQDPQGPPGGDLRGRRGGSFLYQGQYLRLSNRSAQNPSYSDDDMGFRCAR